MVLNIFENDEALDIETNLKERANVLDFIASTEAVIAAEGENPMAAPLANRLAAVKSQVAGVNAQLFGRLQKQIRERSVTPAMLRLEFNQYTDYRAEQEGLTHVGPDTLDMLLDGIMALEEYTDPLGPPGPGMNHYVPTPARAILDAVDHIQLKSEDVFYDLGSGLGRVVILAHLATGVKARGVEINPIPNDRARRSAAQLGLAEVEFINADVRQADYSEGTVFFMYTPIKESIFHEMFSKLEHEARRRQIRLCTLGPCTEWVASQPWVKTPVANLEDPFKVIPFYSIAPTQASS